jgi:ATP-dependent exoDNAse (exonuclease V) beta subunit
LLRWFNDIFQNAFPARQDPVRGEVTYLQAQSPPDKTDEDSVPVAVAAFANHQQQDEARWIAESISRLREEEQERFQDTRSIAILVRNKSHFQPIAEALRQAGLDYRELEMDSLASLPVVQDLVSLLRALLTPADDVAWLALLRAPYCGLHLNALKKLSAGGPIWNRLQDDDLLAELDDQEAQRVVRLRNALRRAFSLRGRKPLTAVLAECWRALGGPQSHPDARSDLATELFFEKLEGQDEGALLDSLSAFAESLEELKAPANPNAPEELVVLTIHKAKGLEFDVVFLPSLAKRPRHDDPMLLNWLLLPEDASKAEPPQLLMAPSPAEDEDETPLQSLVKDLRKDRTSAESLRLLYVGCTRARQKLFLSACLNVKETGTELEVSQPQKSSLLRHIWSPVADSMVASARSNYKPTAVEQTVAAPPPLRVLREEFLPEFRVGLRGKADSAQASPSKEAVDKASAALGDIFHEAMEMAGKTDLLQGSEENLRRLTGWVEWRLESQRLPKLPVAEARQLLVRALENTLRSRHLRWAFDLPPERRQHEVPLSQVRNDSVQDRRIDLLVLDRNDVQWVIDYKLQRTSEQSFELQSSVLRYKAQLEEYAAMLPRESAEIRLALYFPIADEFFAWTPERTDRAAG